MLLFASIAAIVSLLLTSEMKNPADGFFYSFQCDNKQEARTLRVIGTLKNFVVQFVPFTFRLSGSSARPA